MHTTVFMLEIIYNQKYIHYESIPILQHNLAIIHSYEIFLVYSFKKIKKTKQIKPGICKHRPHQQ